MKVALTRIAISGDRLSVRRMGATRWLGHSVDVPLSHVVSVAEAEPGEAKRWYHGIRLAGVQIPGVMTSGLVRRHGELVWWDVRRGGKVVVISFRDESIARLVIEVEDPAAVSGALARALAEGARPEQPPPSA